MNLIRSPLTVAGIFCTPVLNVDDGGERRRALCLTGDATGQLTRTIKRTARALIFYKHLQLTLAPAIKATRSRFGMPSTVTATINAGAGKNTILRS